MYVLPWYIFQHYTHKYIIYDGPNKRTTKQSKNQLSNKNKFFKNRSFLHLTCVHVHLTSYTYK